MADFTGIRILFPKNRKMVLSGRLLGGKIILSSDWNFTKIMKPYLHILFFYGLLFAGCSPKNTVANPTWALKPTQILGTQIILITKTSIKTPTVPFISTSTPDATLTSTTIPTYQTTRKPSFTPTPFPPFSSNWLPFPFQKISIDNINNIKFQKAMGMPAGSAISLDGKFIAMANSRIALFDFKTFREIPLEKTQTKTQNILDFTFSPDGNLLVSIFDNWPQDEDLAIWKTDDGSLLFSENLGGASSLEFNPDGSVLAVGTTGGSVILLDPKNLQEIISWNAAKWVIDDFSFSPDGSKLAVASRDNFFTVWEIPSGKELFRGIGEKDNENLIIGIENVNYASDGSMIITGSGYGFVDVWKVTENPFHVEKTKVWKAENNGSIDTLYLTRDNNLLITSSYSGTQFWKMPEASRLKILHDIECHLSLDETILNCGNSFFGVSK